MATFTHPEVVLQCIALNMQMTSFVPPKMFKVKELSFKDKHTEKVFLLQNRTGNSFLFKLVFAYKDFLNSAGSHSIIVG